MAIENETIYGLKGKQIKKTVSEIKSNAAQIEGIENKIPAQASSSNQLADKDFVNSSVATNTANFMGTYNSLAELESTTGATSNDYGFVIATDASGNTVYNRYKYNGSAWIFEYELNNSSFTAEQWAAIQSGITAGAVTKLNGIESGAEENTIDSISVNGVTQTPDANKNVDIEIPEGIFAVECWAGSTDKTYNEIKAAYDSGKLIVFNYNARTLAFMSSASYDSFPATTSNIVLATLVGGVNMSGLGTPAIGELRLTPHGSDQPYSTQLTPVVALSPQSSTGGSPYKIMSQAAITNALAETAGAAKKLTTPGTYNLWELDPGYYTWDLDDDLYVYAYAGDSNLANPTGANWITSAIVSGTFSGRVTIWLVGQDSSRGLLGYIVNAGNGATSVILGNVLTTSTVQDNLSTSATTQPLSANQGRVLSERIGDLSALTTTAKTSTVAAINEVSASTPIITMTNIDPGDGVSLATNHFIGYYE